MSKISSLNLLLLLENLALPKKSNRHEAQRIFHGRGHAYKDLNHITIDWLSPSLLITLFAPIKKTEIDILSEALRNKFCDCKSIQIQHRYRSDWLVECIYGKRIENIEIIENEISYKLKIKSGINTGLFLDMKNGRKWVKENSKNLRILNLFSYTCGFSVAASAGGAHSIYNIDISRPFLNSGRENHRINQHGMDLIRFEKLNILKSFGRIKRHGPYDLIICDPPTYQKGSIDIVRDYPKLIRRFTEFSNNNALLFLCINTPHIGALTGREFLINMVKKHAPHVTLINEIKPPNVFKESQGKGTKVLVFRV